MKCKQCDESERLHKCSTCNKLICWEHIFDWSIANNGQGLGAMCAFHQGVKSPHPRSLAKFIFLKNV